MRNLILVPMLLSGVLLSAQLPDPDMDWYLARVEKGEADQIRAEIPSLLSRYPNHPGVLYLQGLVTTDGAQAVRINQSVVDNFPGSRWAADALYRVYQYYYALGLYRTAELKMAQLRREYPNSKYVSTDTGVETSQLPEEKDEPTSAVLDSTGVRATSGGEAASAMAPPNEAPTQGSTALLQFSLQVGAYGSQENAQKQKLFFESLGYPVAVQTKVKDSRSLYTVVVGSFETYDEAKAQSLDIKKKYNIDSFVVTR